MRKILEKDIQTGCLQLLRLKGYFVWKQNSSGIYKSATNSFIPSTIPGIADIIGVSPKGMFVAVEVKRPGNKMTDLQIGFQRLVCANKGLHACVTSIDEMQEILNDWDKML